MERICEYDTCTLCMACSNICPQDAIVIGQDINGYECIEIDQEKCIDCGLCKKVCERKLCTERREPHTAYAAQAKSMESLKKSASGGAFQMLAEYVLENNGVCYGCRSNMDQNGFHAQHIRIASISELPMILNSKYVPSKVGNTYKMARKDLEEGHLVLFSGTPCQIQGLKGYLNREYDNLLTVDIVCHGVTSTNLFNDYLREEEQKHRIKIVEYLFRDKSVSWGTNFCYQYYKLEDTEKRVKTKHLPREGSSYMIHYLRGNIFRENCYNCTLSNISRLSDFTLGDYWGIETEHPELVTKSSPPIVLRKGVSCVLANTEKARRYIPALKESMVMYEVSVESVVAHNGNLRSASPRGKGRDRFFQQYKENGYGKIEMEYEASVGRKMLVYRLKNLMKSHLPDRVRIMIYHSPRLRKLVFHS